jgi:hypothetical protein
LEPTIMRAWTVIGTCLGLIAASPAYASELGASDSASFRITVNIPPFLAALAAQAEGAVGLWTVSSNHEALMVKVPDTIAEGAEAEAAIFHNGDTLFTLSAPQSPLVVTSGASSVANGLRRQAFALRATRAQGTIVQPSIATVLVSAT